MCIRDSPRTPKLPCAIAGLGTVESYGLMIRFGTSGWRAVLGEEFTFPNARRVVTAIARAMRVSGDAPAAVVLASDTRFLNERFVDEDAGRLVDEPLVQETCVGREDDCGRRIPRNPHRARDGGDDASRIRERELFPQNRAPAGSTETDHQAVGFYGAEDRNGAWKFR